MSIREAISFFISRHFLTQRWMLWAFFWTNLLGTLYGYQWYWRQMTLTLEQKGAALLVFVPDSPTASLFFTVSICWLLFPSLVRSLLIRGIIGALAVITSLKYGIWAVAMIVAAAFQGDEMIWQDWMLMSSHLAMAVEAVLFARFFGLRFIPIALAAVWTLANDYVDYHQMVYPWLPKELIDDLYVIEKFTIILSVFSVITAFILMKLNKSVSEPVSR